MVLWSFIKSVIPAKGCLRLIKVVAYPKKVARDCEKLPLTSKKSLAKILILIFWKCYWWKWKEHSPSKIAQLFLIWVALFMIKISGIFSSNDQTTFYIFSSPSQRSSVIFFLEGSFSRYGPFIFRVIFWSDSLLKHFQSSRHASFYQKINHSQKDQDHFHSKLSNPLTK